MTRAESSIERVATSREQAPYCYGVDSSRLNELLHAVWDIYSKFNLSLVFIG